MKKIKVTEGIEITNIVIGIEHLGIEAFKQDCFTFIDAYIEAGGNCIDTARLYNRGETDRILGQWLHSRSRRNDIVLCTKGSHNDIDTGEVRLTPKNIVSDLEEALTALGIDHTDIHLLHRDNVKLPVSEIMPVLDKLVKSGKTRAVGNSNWTASRIAEANRFALENHLTPFVTSSIQYSPAVTTPAATSDLTHIIMNDVEYGWYKETQFPLIAYSAQARGYFIKRAKGELNTRESVSRFYDHFPENHRRAQRIEHLAKEIGRSVSEICVAYVLCSGLKAAALLTVSKLSQMEHCFDAHDLLLTQEQIRYLQFG
jgi:aryl-alcohol dehydrogenase-like predicted oxidoreductase